MAFDPSQVFSPATVQELSLGRWANAASFADTIRRGRDRLARIERNLRSQNLTEREMHNWEQKRRRLQDALSEAEEVLPSRASYVGGTFADDGHLTSDDAVSERGLIACKSARCFELLDARSAYEHSGLCPECFTAATTGAPITQPWPDLQNIPEMNIQRSETP